MNSSILQGVPEEGNLDKILRPPHGGRLHQIPTEDPGPTKPQYLRRHHHNQRHPKSQRLAVKYLHGAHNMNRVRISGAGVGEDRDQHMFFHIERSGVEWEFVLLSLEENPISNGRRHEVAKRDDGDLSWNRGYRERLTAIPEELIEERK